MDPDGIGALRTLFVSDVHLKPGDPEQQSTFVRFLDHARKTHALYLLGDIFDFWLGPRHLRAADYRKALEGIRGVADSGTQVWFVPGNRDYFVEKKFEIATGARILPESARLELGGRRVLAAHGDFIYNRNPKYTAYRRLMRFPPLQKVYLSMPESMSRGIVRGFRKVSVRTTPAVTWGREELVAEAKPHFGRGVDVLVCGHIHAPQHVRSEHRGRPRDIFILGDWEGGTRDYLEFDGAFRLKCWER